MYLICVFFCCCAFFQNSDGCFGDKYCCTGVVSDDCVSNVSSVDLNHIYGSIPNSTVRVHHDGSNYKNENKRKNESSSKPGPPPPQNDYNHNHNHDHNHHGHNEYNEVDDCDAFSAYNEFNRYMSYSNISLLKGNIGGNVNINVNGNVNSNLHGNVSVVDDDRDEGRSGLSDGECEDKQDCACSHFPQPSSACKYYHCCMIPYLIDSNNCIKVCMKKASKVELLPCVNECDFDFHQSCYPRTRKLAGQSIGFFSETKRNEGMADLPQAMVEQLFLKYPQIFEYHCQKGGNTTNNENNSKNNDSNNNNNTNTNSNQIGDESKKEAKPRQHVNIPIEWISHFGSKMFENEEVTRNYQSVVFLKDYVADDGGRISGDPLISCLGPYPWINDALSNGDDNQTLNENGKSKNNSDGKDGKDSGSEGLDRSEVDRIKQSYETLCSLQSLQLMQVPTLLQPSKQHSKYLCHHFASSIRRGINVLFLMITFGPFLIIIAPLPWQTENILSSPKSKDNKNNVKNENSNENIKFDAKQSDEIGEIDRKQNRKRGNNNNNSNSNRNNKSKDKKDSKDNKNKDREDIYFVSWNELSQKMANYNRYGYVYFNDYIDGKRIVRDSFDPMFHYIMNQGCVRAWFDKIQDYVSKSNWIDNINRGNPGWTEGYQLNKNLLQLDYCGNIWNDIYKLPPFYLNKDSDGQIIFNFNQKKSKKKKNRRGKMKNILNNNNNNNNNNTNTNTNNNINNNNGNNNNNNHNNRHNSKKTQNKNHNKNHNKKHNNNNNLNKDENANDSVSSYIDIYLQLHSLNVSNSNDSNGNSSGNGNSEMSSSGNGNSNSNYNYNFNNNNMNNNRNYSNNDIDIKKSSGNNRNSGNSGNIRNDRNWGNNRKISEDDGESDKMKRLRRIFSELHEIGCNVKVVNNSGRTGMDTIGRHSRHSKNSRNNDNNNNRNRGNHRSSSPCARRMRSSMTSSMRSSMISTSKYDAVQLLNAAVTKQNDLTRQMEREETKQEQITSKSKTRQWIYDKIHENVNTNGHGNAHRNGHGNEFDTGFGNVRGHSNENINTNKKNKKSKKTKRTNSSDDNDDDDDANVSLNFNYINNYTYNYNYNIYTLHKQ